MRLSEAYQILELSAAAGDQEVRKAFAALSRKYHPEEEPEQYQRIYEAYRTIAEARRDRRRGSLRNDTAGPDKVSEKPASQSRPEGAHTGVFAAMKAEAKEKNSEDAPNPGQLKSQTKARDAAVWGNTERNGNGPAAASPEQKDSWKLKDIEPDSTTDTSAESSAAPEEPPAAFQQRPAASPESSAAPPEPPAAFQQPLAASPESSAAPEEPPAAFQQPPAVPPEVQARLSAKKKRREQRFAGTAVAIFLITVMFFRMSLSIPPSQQLYFYPFLLLISVVILLSKLFSVPALSPLLGGLSGLIYWLCFYIQTDFAGLAEVVRQGVQTRYADEIVQRAEQMKLHALSEQLSMFKVLLTAGLLLSGGLFLVSLPILLYQLSVHQTSLQYWEQRQCPDSRILRKGVRLDRLPTTLTDRNFCGIAYTMDEDGRIIQYGHYVKGVLHGLKMEKDTYGLLRKVTAFSKGHPRFETQWYSSGKLMEFIRFHPSGKQQRQLYAENGALLYSSEKM